MMPSNVISRRTSVVLREVLNEAFTRLVAQANMQPKLVESERGVEISKNLANAEIEKSTGDARAIEIRAERAAKATRLTAGAADNAPKTPA